ncbi:MAG: selenocysteine lyase/cysteine desulfurase [Gammaproteobacteria bacterium]|jgi:selenocysteine lyase/cysteine desulfurase
MQLDIDFVRQQFSQLDDDPEFVFASNAGGSFVCNQVNDLMTHYNRHTRVQPYSRFSPSREAGQAMDRAKQLWADTLNIQQAELTIGPSTSINTYVMSQAISTAWVAGDEIIVTNQDHEANSGVWRRKALEKGVTIKQWEVDKQTGLLDIEQLLPSLSHKTRWVFFTHCSNIVGTANPVAEITRQIKAQSNARVFVDAVAHAPHHIHDLKQLGVDGYVFSLYKVFGPHQSILYVNQAIHAELSSQAHYFNIGKAGYDFNPAGPQHSQVAACAGVVDYFDTLHLHHYGDSNVSQPQKMADLHSLFQAHENSLAQPILSFLDHHADVQLIGKPQVNDNDRAPTIAFKPLRQSSEALASQLQDSGIGTENGNFYAHRLVTDLGFDADDGVVRISLVHYDRACDVEKILLELDRALN